jgi:hypothetical protein
MTQKSQTRSKLIRRVIIALEILILVAAFAAIRYAASLPKHYQIVYHDRYSDSGGIDLLQPDTGKTIRLINTIQGVAYSCDIELIHENTTSVFGGGKLWEMSSNNTREPLLLEFWSAGEVQTTIYNESAVVKYDASRIEVGLTMCTIWHPDGG